MRPSYKIHLMLDISFIWTIYSISGACALCEHWTYWCKKIQLTLGIRHKSIHILWLCNTYDCLWVIERARMRMTNAKKPKINWWPNLKFINAFIIFSLAFSSLACSIHVLGLCVSLILIVAFSFSNAQLMFNTDDTGFSKGNWSNP